MIPTQFLCHSGWVDLCDHPKCGPPGGAFLLRYLVLILFYFYLLLFCCYCFVFVGKKVIIPLKKCKEVYIFTSEVSPLTDDCKKYSFHYRGNSMALVHIFPGHLYNHFLLTTQNNPCLILDQFCYVSLVSRKKDYDSSPIIALGSEPISIQPGPSLSYP